MAVIVKLNDVVDQLEMLMDECAAYLNKRTGELYMLMEEELLDADEDGPRASRQGQEAEAEDAEEEDLGEDPEWLREAKVKAREVVNSDDWLELPSKFDIHEYQIMEDFCRAVDDEEISERLLRNIRGSGAFGRFKAAIDVLGLEQDWYQFRREAFERIAIEWLDENGIEYTTEEKKEGSRQ
jgi:hypothetical protein